MRTKILDINFDNDDIKIIINKMLDAVKNNQKCFIVTPNPEIVMLAQKDHELKKILNSADIIIPDGIGIVLASKLNKTKIKKRLAGYDLVQEFFSVINKNINQKDKNYKIYFLGSKKETVELAKKNMLDKYNYINIVGTHDGYFDLKNKIQTEKIIEEINLKQTDILLVGMGAPKQEKFIYQNINKLNAKIFIGVGGSFDVMSGKIKRAPIFFQKFGLEWLYRFIKQPKRFFRILSIPKFIFCVLLNKINKKKYHNQ